MTSYVEELYLCIPTQKFKNIADVHEYVLELHFFFSLIPWIELCDKKDLTFVDCFNRILSHQLTPDRSYTSFYRF